MLQLIFHLIGDYILQSDWQANTKTSKNGPALIHAILYSALFSFIASPKALVIIGVTHFLIDRFRLARYVVFAKNFLAPKSEWPNWYNCSSTGYPSERPAWLAVWLLIIADNTLHLTINYLAIYYLG